MQLKHALLFLAAFIGNAPLSFAQSPENDPLRNDYSQWKLAAGAGKVAEPVSISTRPGFEVEIVRSAGADEGSWISLTFDERQRLLVGREDKGILRFTFDGNRKSVERVETVNDTLLEPRGLLIAHDSLYVTANNSLGLYRLRDSDGDDRYDQVQLLRQLDGLVGHGRNGMALGPDGKIYVALGNNVKIPADVSPQSPYRGSQLDRLLPCAWNEFLFDNDVTPPAGHIARTDADGKTWEIVAGGFRNPYDLAFNRDGQLFTYDADMEWDIGAPWYRATCVMHVVPGGEYGWRQGTSVWPDHFADSLPRVVDVGLGSPTGVAFGDKSHFPAPYRDALFILDWAYGRILAVHLSPNGASYTGRVETFLKGKPLNVTDVTFGPDGAMYFLVGGRRTRSALYRVRYTGDDKVIKSDEPKPKDTAEHRQARQALEPLLTAPSADALETIWSQLAGDDAFVRHTARTALERLPVASWQARAMQEPQPRRAIQALMALARVGTRNQQLELIERLRHWLKQPLEENERLAALRTAQLAMIRFGSLTEEQATQWRKTLEPTFPAKTSAENYLLAELLVALDSPVVVKGALSLIPEAESDRQRLWYLYVLRQAQHGWSLDLRRNYLHWLKESEKFAGAHYLPRFIIYIRTDALAAFTDAERQALATEIDQLGRLPEDIAATPTATRAEVQKWTVESLTAELAKISRPVDTARGQKLYAEAQCVRCHRFGKSGIPFGPDLTQVGSRFSQRDVLDAVLQPSRVIDDKYRTLLLESEDGLTVSGFLVGGNADEFFVAPDPLHPTTFRRIPRHQIAQRKVSPLSPMPEGLLNTFTAEEIYDLLGVLLADGTQPRE